jgi:Calcineurin-like phosphoesterase
MNVNKKEINQILSSSYIHSSSIIATFLIVVVLYFSISSNDEREAFSIEDQNTDTKNQNNNNRDNIKKHDATLAFGNNNFIAVGDWYCNKETEKTIENILAIDPEVIITTGDHVKDEKSAKCWIDMSEKIKDRMRIAIGNHDVEFANIYKQIVDYHHIKNSYYSHNFQNVHFISMSTEHPYEEGSKQYEFIKNDLEETAKNPDLDWIIVHQHKPLYSTKQDKDEAEELRNTYQELFQHYDVDLVISSHNQYYERTYPLLYNYESDGDPIITEYNKLEYPPTNGIVFLTVGTAGDELDPVKERPGYYVIQESEFGFLNINIENNGKTLIGEFHSNKGNIIDHFELEEI